MLPKASGETREEWVFLAYVGNSIQLTKRLV
uniref:Uncharacterized protein n=1 Tax=Anguilla anguilla TaxID=7936 RepID=A0A0E9PRG7_ANGAN